MTVRKNLANIEQVFKSKVTRVQNIAKENCILIPIQGFYFVE